MEMMYGSSSVFPMQISGDDLDLALKAMAENLVFFKDGMWQCRPAPVLVTGSEEQASCIRKLLGKDKGTVGPFGLRDGQNLG
jgi:hypothetical protein